jgi:hypothetical protein
VDLEILVENVLNAATAGITIGCIYGLMCCIVPGQKGRPVVVHPESIAVSKAVWRKMS